VLALMNVGRDRGSSYNFPSDLYSVELYRRNFRMERESVETTIESDGQVTGVV
jgi:hypothetical protein